MERDKAHELSVLNTRIPRDLHKRLRLEAIMRDTEISKLVTECLSKCFPAERAASESR